MTERAPIRHLVRLHDLSDEELERVLATSARLKRERRHSRELEGRTAGLLFFRGSLRTRTSFEAAVHQLGAHAVDLNAASDFWELEARDGALMDGPAPEHIRDAAAVLSRYLDVLAIRPPLAGRSWDVDRKDESIQAWATHADVPVINMESALWHPLQALADLLTLREALGALAARRLAICWTHSPTPQSSSVVHSLLLATLRAGMDVAIAHPAGYELDEGVLDQARALAGERGRTLQTGLEPRDAVRGAQIVYARSWHSLEHYGNLTLAASRRARTGSWRVDEELLSVGDQARVMHAMPVRRNLEVTDEVLDGPRSLLYQQAENRLHSQKALLLHLLGPGSAT